jgi:hypothetical protein
MATSEQLFTAAPVAVEPPQLTRYQLIEAIVAINASAPREHYLTFDESQLRRYLEHLRCAEAPRDKSSRWQRDRYEPAVERRENDD